MAAKNENQGKVLAVVNRKGGVAKTTTAISLAHGLSRRLMLKLYKKDLGKVEDRSQIFEYNGRYYYLRGHVLLIDFDPQGHCARGLGIDPGDADIGKVLLGKQKLNQAVISADRSDVGYPRPNLWLLPSSDALETAKEELRGSVIARYSNGSEGWRDTLVRILSHRLNLALQRFTYIVLDCPPALDIFTQAVYQFADTAIVPVKPDFFSMAGTGQHLTDIFNAQLRGIEIEIHTIVPTFSVKRQRLDRQILSELREQHGEMVSEPIPRSQMVAEAPAYQQTIFEFDPNLQSPATVAYQQLVDRVYHG